MLSLIYTLRMSIKLISFNKTSTELGKVKPVSQIKSPEGKVRQEKYMSGDGVITVNFDGNEVFANCRVD